MLTAQDKQRIEDFYAASLKEYGDHDARAVHWSSEERQKIRFSILLQIANLNQQSVLDVGCGLGDLYKYCLEQHIDINYSGIDIIPEFVEKAHQKYPEATFLHTDIFDMTDTFDFVIASGALSFKVENNDLHYKEMIKKMYAVSRKGLAFNMLNHSTHIDDATFATYDPHEISDFCKTFCNDVQIVIGYLPEDFTIYMYK